MRGGKRQKKKTAGREEKKKKEGAPRFVRDGVVFFLFLFLFFFCASVVWIPFSFSSREIIQAHARCLGRVLAIQ